uniref:Retrovirus-related Pol polyprotein from transposon TNT 1-94-like beta-barrel domain-containing protein n=1 Tax=Nicotiana tabacum TaxID=4097 RepID=A0A1S3ZZ01_TOBAC|nr:PREDICTED: uncharacterized protein LOC107791934 [Nicotiana tabacum]
MTEIVTPVVGSTSNIATFSRSVPPSAPAGKPEIFFEIDFKRWQQKMFFYLNTLSPQNFIKEDVPVLSESTLDNERFIVTEAWKHSDFLCKNYILSGLEDDLYNVYSNAKTSKELWNALEKKYKTENAGLKKFVAAKFLDYKMVDNKPVITQVQELQVIINDLLDEGFAINEAFQVATMIEKLPPLCRDFKKYLKYKCNEMKLEDLIIRLRIEEDNKVAEKKTRGNSTIMGANIVETTPTSPKKRKKSSGPNNYPSKKKFKGNYHNCEKFRHKVAECRAPKKEKKRGQANMVETNDDINDLCAMLSECNLVGNPKELWIDSDATRHVCTVREAFASYAPAGPGEIIFMENSATTKIEDYGKVFLKITSGKVVTLNNVCHVPEIRKNLVSISLLVKNGFKCVFVSDKVVISKNAMYLGKMLPY